MNDLPAWLWVPLLFLGIIGGYAVLAWITQTLWPRNQP